MTIHSNNGFTLVEMAIVMFIMALMLGSGLTLMSAQQKQQKIEETKARLDEAREALIGFAIAKGRLPCPASPSSNGMEELPGGLIPTLGGAAACPHALDGFLPAVTLGLSNVDNHGYLQDAWRLQQNRIRYVVTKANTGANANAATAINGIKTLTMSTFTPDLHVCDSASEINATNCGLAATTLTSDAIVVIYSLGANAATTSATAGAGIDEQANQDGDIVFVSHTITVAKDRPTNGEFDDQVTWLSKYILFNRMVQAGKLP
ncbi:MAG: type II secretion system protein [Gallionella sp.]